MQSVSALEVYQAGELTVIGFGGREILDDLNVAECRDELVDLIRQNQCKVLAFDLTRVRLVPSGLLGLLASIRKQGVEVHLYNPSSDIREVLEITKLDQVLTSRTGNSTLRFNRPKSRSSRPMIESPSRGGLAPRMARHWLAKPDR